jgi:hypothetical protein
MTTTSLSAAAVIRLLDLAPHRAAFDFAGFTLAPKDWTPSR